MADIPNAAIPFNLRNRESIHSLFSSSNTFVPVEAGKISGSSLIWCLLATFCKTCHCLFSGVKFVVGDLGKSCFHSATTYIHLVNYIRTKKVLLALNESTLGPFYEVLQSLLEEKLSCLFQPLLFHGLHSFAHQLLAL